MAGPLTTPNFDPEPGDVVRLKSGGVPMTVWKRRNENGDVKCLWLSEDGYRQEGFFPALLLTPDQPRSAP